MKVVWISRHELSAIQADDLARHLGGEYTYTHENILWSASEDAERDKKENRAIWSGLISKYDVIAGVFPPTALEAASGEIKLLSPISAQKPELRIGEGPIPFVHVRWAEVIVGRD
jgi:hypothetical protein